MESLSPAEITAKSDEIACKKISCSFGTSFVSGILAGVYISFGAVFSLVSISGLSGEVPFGIIKLIAGLTFSLGLILVMIAGAELFTGNALLIVSCLNKKISYLQMIKNLTIIWFSNFVGALMVVALLYFSDWGSFGGGLVGSTVLSIGVVKIGYTFSQAFFLGVLCNILVCLGVWLAWSGRSTADKVLGIIFPITAFVAAGFEHSVANMLYLPYAYVLHLSGFAVSNLDTSVLTLQSIFFDNLLPVTLGNILGGALFVGAAYWTLYGRKKSSL